MPIEDEQTPLRGIRMDFGTPHPDATEETRKKSMKKAQETFNKIRVLIQQTEQHVNRSKAPKEELSFFEARRRTHLLEQAEESITALSLTLAAIPMEPEDRAGVNETIETYYTTHCTAISVFESIVHDHERAERLEEAANAPVPVTTQSRSTDDDAFKVKLPQFKLPDFDGRIESWTPWAETYKAMIHGNPKLSAIVKFSYLKAAMKFPAGQKSLVDNFTMSESSYEDAWNALCKRYDDPRKTKAHLFQRLLTVPSMKSDSADEILRIVDEFTAIEKTLKVHKATYDELLVHVVNHRLNDATKLEWQKFADDLETVTFDALMEFLAKYSSIVSSLSSRVKKPTSKPPDIKGSSSKNFASSSTSCVACSENHPLFMCPKFKAHPVVERQRIVEEHRLCRNCFSSRHIQRACSSKFRCKICKRDHHTLLHFENSRNNSPGSSESQQNSAPPPLPHVAMNPMVPPFRPPPLPTVTHPPRSNLATMTAPAASSKTEALLSTVQFFALNANNQWVLGRALLDSGAQGNHVTMGFIQKLGLPLVPSRHPVIGINGQCSTSHFKAEFNFASRYSDFSGTACCTVSDDITGILPNRRIDVSQLDIPPGLFLADPDFSVPGQIDVLFGTGVFHDCLLGNILKRPNSPTFVETRFGYTVGGIFPVESSFTAPTLISCYTQHSDSADQDLNEKIDKFIDVETFGAIPKRILSPEHQYCLHHYDLTTVHDEEAEKVTVVLPKKEGIETLESNYENAARQFFYQEKKRQNNPPLNVAYVKYMSMLIDTSRASEVPAEFDDGFFMPHHGVEKPQSTSTSVRPVNNGSSKSRSGQSLNDCLCVGPNVQPDLFQTLLRFRFGAYVLKSDIEKMYLQVLVAQPDRKYQKILWRSSPDEPLKHFTLNCVTFGLAPSAFQATNTLNFAARKYADEHPQGSSAIDRFYVDDFVFTCDDLAVGLSTRSDVTALLKKIGFPLRKWSSNQPELLAGLLPADLDSPVDDAVICKTLGVRYSPKTDMISFPVIDSADAPNTKAELLSQIASFYDPLGLAGPVVVIAKLHMKLVRKLSWNEKLPDEVKESWENFKSKLPSLHNFEVPRHAVITNAVSTTLHAFSDASLEAYGVAFYIRSADTAGNVQVTLLCSKSRVSPPKQQTIARLELCAATLMAKMMSSVVDSLDVNFASKTLWIDSMAVLYWITTEPSKLSVFVGHRVNAIQESTADCSFRHLPTHLMPADKLSRGLQPDELVDDDVWFHGPAFLMLPPQEWPETKLEVCGAANLEAEREIRKNFVSKKENSLLTFVETRFSNVSKIVRHFVLIRRLIPRSPHRSKPVTLDETEEALENIIRILQRAFFPEECKFFDRRNDDETLKFPSRSPLLQLKPFVNSRGTICVGGRLRASSGLTERQKHPFILPSCHFTKLLIRELHHEHCHPGNASMLSFVREKYWILGARSIIRRVKHECLECFRVKPPLPEQIMGDLPPARLEMRPVFIATAVDYAGPFNMRTSLARNSSITKVYVAVYRCMVTGLVHLEPVTSLTTEAFITCFDRFVSRRGLPRDIYCDNGTNFVGADREFARILKEIEPEIRRSMSEKNIHFHFTTPGAPHAGGVYEAIVKMMKHHLVRLCAYRSFVFEQLVTILCKAEAIINSRPLTPLSDDVDDFRVLTPAHFLLGRSLIAKPERNFLPLPTNRLNTYNEIQQIQQKFWDCWYHDYLHHLQTRPKRFRTLNEFHVGDFVLLKDNNLPPLKWQMGRIVQLFPDQNKEVRNVLVKMSKRDGEVEHKYKHRHVKYLAFLPKEDSEQPAAPGVCSPTETE